MKVILNIDPIKMPLTGIGRYTQELGLALERSGHLQEFRLWRGNNMATGWPDQSEPVQEQFEEPWGDQLKKWVLSRPSASRGFGRAALKVYLFLNQRRMLRRLNRYRDHIYHSPNFYLPPFDGAKVVTVHDLSFVKVPDCCPEYRLRLMEEAIEQVRKRADYILTVSEFARREIMDLLTWPPDKIKATPVAAAEIFHPRSRDELIQPLAKLGLEPGGYSLFVGTVEPRKNVGVLLDAYERLPASLRNHFPLVISGFEGWRSQALLTRLKTLAGQSWLRYLGFQSAENLPLLMAGAALFLFPSLYEGFGLPPLEAMQSGVPVIVSDRASLPEVVGPDISGLAPEDTEAWQEAICRGLEDQAWRTEMISMGLKRAKEFSWDRCAQETLTAYQEATAER